MISAALRYPLLDPIGRSALLVATGSVLGVAIGVRYAVDLYPLALAVVPAGAALAAVLVLAGTVVSVLSGRERSLPSLRGSAAAGARTLVLATTTLALPVALLLGSVTSFAELDPDLDPSAPVFFLLGSTSALVLFVAVCYALPVIVRVAVRTGSFRTAVDWARLKRVLGSIEYLQAWTIGFPLVVGAWGLATLALASESLGGLVAAVAGGYLLLAGTHVLAAGYESVPGIEGFDADAGDADEADAGDAADTDAADAADTDAADDAGDDPGDDADAAEA